MKNDTEPLAGKVALVTGWIARHRRGRSPGVLAAHGASVAVTYSKGKGCRGGAREGD